LVSGSLGHRADILRRAGCRIAFDHVAWPGYVPSIVAAVMQSITQAGQQARQPRPQELCTAAAQFWVVSASCLWKLHYCPAVAAVVQSITPAGQQAGHPQLQELCTAAAQFCVVFAAVC
jgi:hypothetical protein